MTYNIDIENAVLGAIILEPHCLRTIQPLLKEDLFYDEKNQAVYRAIMAIQERSQSIDILTVCSELKTIKMLDFVGGAHYVSGLTMRMASAANIQTHVYKLNEWLLLRELIRVSNHIVKRTNEPNADCFDIIEEANNELKSMLQFVSNNTKHVGDIFNAVVDDIQKSMDSPSIAGVPSGLTKLDHHTGGWQDGTLVVLAARPGMGKAQPHFAKVLTPNGFVTMGEIQPGDQIINSNGGVSYVTGKFPQGSKPIFKVSFSDETNTFCCDEHLWLTKTRKERKNYLSATVKNTKDIACSLRVTNDQRLNHSIEYVRPVDFKERLTVIHPYFLGVIIGDFCNRKMQIMNPEKDIIARISSLLPIGDDLRKIKSKDTYSVAGNQTRTALRVLGLSECLSYEKFIPHQYLYNSVENRIDLLRGLMDTDGHVVEKSYLEYSTTSIRLSKDIKNLVLSLGGRCTVHEHLGKCNGKICRPYYRMNISFTNEIVPVSSFKHLKKYSGSVRKLPKFIKSIEPFGEFDCSCISVSSHDSLYVTDDYILTHNTACALQFAKYPAIALNKAVAVFSLEMTARQLVGRLAASESEVSSSAINQKAINHAELQRIGARCHKLIGAPIYIDDTPNIKMADLRIKAIKLKMDYDIKLLIVDYLQLMHGDLKGNREQEISYITRGLKTLSKELEIPVIALSQLSREVEKRDDKRPQLSDLRESGAIEQDADIVMFLWRAEYYDLYPNGYEYKNETISTRNLMVIDIAKGREIKTGEIAAKFYGEYMIVSDYEQKPDSETINPLEANTNFLNQ